MFGPFNFFKQVIIATFSCSICKYSWMWLTDLQKQPSEINARLHSVTPSAQYYIIINMICLLILFLMPQSVCSQCLNRITFQYSCPKCKKSTVMWMFKKQTVQKSCAWHNNRSWSKIEPYNKIYNSEMKHCPIIYHLCHQN